MAAITSTALVKEYPGGVRGVDGVDLEVRDGEFFALLGPSGCGKTTLLRSVAGLESITEGRLHIGDRDVTDTEPGERGVAMVFQDYALFPHMDVADNIAYPLKIRRVRRTARRGTAEEVGTGLSLDGLMGRRPGQLSGGQQQRVALARAVATRPDVLLLDEPLSNLDARLRLEARTFLKELQRELGVTTVFVTHDQAEALALADRIAVMRDGQLQQVGDPREVFRRPATTFVASFIGSTPMNLLPGTISDGGVRLDRAETSPVPLPPGVAPAEGTEVVWGARPEYLGWSAEPPADGGGIAAEVTVTESLGATTLVTAHAGAERLQVVVDEDDEPEPGARGWVVAPPRRTLLFDAASTALIETEPSRV
ncbi:ABC transporter ATP-binding protein [Ruania alba]|uniref:ABC-type sugar transport system, ATPase component n=1 Tax=Ruania alba TaxID=648782 RepID=A0A1H5DX29_9MICO|nr:ABC transporter ATP-binding protein [Ruania alba]SED83489.1 ABC-type sugar transport system, ATPase component [Ruania alba]